ncbi:S-layer protein domain-containing protein [Methanolobus profundi]|uniref:S-layer family duplication domain-containing protein n=1 Tax=Methanolobus profundi TaxID=487685 RepID=A0A1I4SNR8_9EURY|nr:S-layer protein domain-containing protein [Methanolobus profundi]SFM66158.1 S-layer family duplication domain-containing protein [Methanolobus profundi]
MKRFTTIALVALLALAALVVPATAIEESIEVRSTIINGTDFADVLSSGDIEFNTTNFAGFWYDIDEDLSSETLTIVNNSAIVSGEAIGEDGLVYNATIVQNEYEGDFAGETDVTGDDNMTYPLIGLFADKYVPTADDDAGELVKLLLDTDDKYTLRTGSALELVGGYELTAKQIDVEGDKVWMELSKDGEFVEDEVIDVTDGEATWDYDVDVGDQSDVIVFRVLITDVFQGQVDSLAVVEGLWLIDYENILEIESSDEFGELEVDSVSNTITMYNSGTISLTSDKEIELAEDFMLKTADNTSVLRYYPFIERTIGEEMAVDDTDAGDSDEEMPADDVVEGNESEAVDMPEDDMAEDDMPAEEEDEEPADETAEEESPGFEAVFAVAGLLAVAYLVRRD